MNKPKLQVVEASAGTGKTYSLVTRIIALLADPSAPAQPEQIVALTFTRKAAGEIFERLVERLAKAGASEDGARKESRNIGREDDPPGAEFFTGLLRRMISRQHLSAAGTIDSFMLKILKAVPFEAGMGGAAEIAGDYRAEAEKRRIVERLLGEEGGKYVDLLETWFNLASDGGAERAYAARLEAFIDSWHGTYGRWTAEKAGGGARSWCAGDAIWPGGAPDGLESASRERIRRATLPLEELRGKRGVGTFIDKARDWRGGKFPKPPKALEGDRAAAAVMREMALFAIGRRIRFTDGIYWLMRSYGELYRENIRSSGRIAFDDIPLLLAELDAGTRAALEYRLDSHYIHWALDEFQDTSGAQWTAIKNLVDESAQSEEARSVFIVGDRKQAIYAWRGGDSRLMAEQTAKAAAAGSLSTRDKTRRCAKKICEAVNKVFCEGHVRPHIGMDGADDAWKWKFKEHEWLEGAPEGFVEVIQAEKSGALAKFDDMFAPVERALAEAEADKGLHVTAILVRSNEHARRLVEHLRGRGFDNVAYAGESSIFDSPAVEAFVNLAKLAAYPADKFAYSHIMASPLAKTRSIAGGSGKKPSQAALSALLLERFTRDGLERTMREIRNELIAGVPDSWNDATGERFSELLRAAKDFDTAREGSEGIADFAQFAEKKTRRDDAAQAAVKVMTMHQAKGLEFDHVIVPFCEKEKICDVRRESLLEDEGGGWILAHPGADAAEEDATLKEAEKRRRWKVQYEALCLAYVAMTRAKTALTLILNPLNKADAGKPGDSAERISDLVRMCGLETAGDAAWWKAAPERTEAAAGEDESGDEVSFTRRPRGETEYSRPSEDFPPGIDAGTLFSRGFGGAARRGTELHEKYAAVEWLDSAADGFDGAFLKPSPDATVWREKKYELYSGGTWETGRFDRVVFSGGRATIYDFKTNAPENGETREAFERRLRETYAPQMAAYRRALCALACLAPSSVDTVLLSSALRACIAV